MTTNNLKARMLSLWSRLCYGSKNAKGFAAQKGQAIVEYVLILVVVVGIVLGLMHQFSDAFRQYVQSYFGDYLACLLETGEMPSLGGDGIDAGLCNSEFEPFNLANGRPMKLAVAQGGDAAAAKRAADARKQAAARRRAAARRAASARVARTANTTHIGERHFSGSSESKKTTRIKRKSLGSNSYDVSGFGPYDQYRSRRLRMQGKIRTTSKIKNKDKKEESKVQKKVKGNNSEARRPRRLVFDPKKLRRDVAQKANTELDISIGDYLRYLLIFGILAAMIIFFGGQFASISKAWEKGD